MQDLTMDINCPSCQRKVKIKIKDMVPGPAILIMTNLCRIGGQVQVV